MFRKVILTNRFEVRVSTAGAIVLAIAFSAGAVQPPPAPPKQGSEPGVLAGPKVEPAGAPITLVRRDFGGRLERLDMPAEEAAMKLLTLSGEEKQHVALVLNERAALIDKAISNNIPMLLKLQGFREASRGEKLAMLREWGEVLRPLRAQGKLADELAAGLTPKNAAAMRAMAKEYWDALLEEGMKGDADGAMMAEDGGKAAKPTRAQVTAREYLLALGGEIKRSYDRVIASRAAQLDEALKAVDATDDQKAQITAIGLEYFQKTLGKPSGEQRREYVLKILSVLDPEQKAKLLRELYGR